VPLPPVWENAVQFDILLEHLINGLTLGAFYALVTTGLALIFGVARLINFAHGDFIMVGGYCFVLLSNRSGLDISYPVEIVLVVAAMAVFSVIIARVVIIPIIGMNWRLQVVATLGISIVLQNLALILFTSDPQQTPTPFTAQITEVLGVRISAQRLIIFAAAAAVFIGLQWFVRHTKAGKAIRAVSQNRLMCEVVGIDVRRVVLMTFAISGALAGLAAVLIAPLFSVSPNMGSLITLKGLAAVIMGGLGQVNGAVYAAFILGLSESLFAGYVSFAYKDVALFTIFILVLLLRPQGLFGKKLSI
jgi:branched-chain amino acid transport system permease protein